MLKLIRRNVWRNPRRTLLTVGSVMLALLLLSLLLSLLSAMERAEGSADNRVVVRHAVSLTFMLPESYGRKLEAVDHVEAVTPLNWFGGIYKDEKPENFFAQFSSDPATLPLVYPELQMPEEQWEAWRKERSGFIAGKALADKYGWRIGDEIFLEGVIWPVDLQLTLRGIYEEPAARSVERQIFFHRAYLEEAMDNPGLAGSYVLKIDDPASVPAVVSASEALFQNSDAQVRAETEKAFQLSFLEMLGNIRLFFGAIGLAVVISIFFITANTMAMAARERTTEVAVLKSLGFRGRHVVTMVAMESVLVGLLGAVLGAGLGFLLVKGVAVVLEKVFPVFGTLRMTPGILALGLGLGLAIGLLSGLVPAVAAARLRIVDGLRRVE